MDPDQNNLRESKKMSDIQAESASTKKPSKFREFIHKHKTIVIVSTILVISLIAFGIGFYFLRYGKTKTAALPSPDTQTAGSSVECIFQ